MAPRTFGTGSPLCARCGKAVYAAEQVIGPRSKPYHKPCLACTVCNKRLDSTLLAEHEGEPYCKNCHKAHLGQGKGGFGLSVPLRPEKPSSLKSQTTGASTSSTGSAGRGAGARGQSVDDEMAQHLSGISIAPRKDNPPPVTRYTEESSTMARNASPSRPRVNMSKPTTVAQSIDDLVASGYEVPVPYARGARVPADQRPSDAAGNHGAASEQKAELASALHGQEARSPLKAGDRFAKSSAEVLEERSSSPSKTSSQDTDFQHSFASHTPTSSTASAVGPRTPPPPSGAGRDVAGAVAMGTDGLPPPTRKDPIALARERERGLMSSGGSGMAKTYSPRTNPHPSRSPPKTSAPYNQAGSAARGLGRDVESDGDGYIYTPNSALAKMGLGSTVNAAAVGTPLCARCERPVYFAEQKQAASRKWHRACLRCDGCSTTLEAGKLEEGPLSATYEHPTNVWCRPCYAKRFGPKGIGVAGISLPEMSR